MGKGKIMEKCLICGAESEITGDNIIKDCCTDCSAKLSILEQGNDGESYQAVLSRGIMTIYHNKKFILTIDKPCLL